MRVQLQKFGSILTSREAGREALSAFRQTLNQLQPNEIIEIDFSDVGTLSPSWADEFLSKLQDEFGDRLVFMPTGNLSAKSTIALLEKIRGKQFNYEKKRNRTGGFRGLFSE